MRYAIYFLLVIVAFAAGYQWALYRSPLVFDTSHAAAPATQKPKISPPPVLNAEQGEPSNIPIQTAQKSLSPPLPQEGHANEITAVPSVRASASTSAPKTPQLDASDSPQPNELPPRPAAEVLAEMVADDGSTAFPNPSAEPHQTLTSQSPDPDWSEQAAQQLRDYFTTQLGTRFEFPMIACGQNICEIQAASLRDGSVENDVRDFQTVFYQMHAQPWWDQLQFDETTLRVQSKPKRAFFVCFITRK
jgi:hypothetical protein